MRTISKIILLLLIPFSFFIAVDNSFATDTWLIKIKVTEYIPWACENDNALKDLNCSVDSPCDCYIKKWFGSVTTMIWNVIKYFTFIAGLGAVLFIVINGILYSMSWVNDSMKTDAKNRIVKTLMWLIVLLLSWIILNIIAPWIYQL